MFSSLLSLRACRGAARAGVVLVLAVSALAASAAPPLPALGVEGAVTVSGISSGGYMAVQFQVAHSALVDGAGVFAAGPYDCAQGSMRRALDVCMEPSSAARLPKAAETRAHIEALARAGAVDAVENLGDDRVWVLSGGRDRTVAPAVVDALVDFYRSVLPADAVRYLKVADAGHAMITVAAPQANACETSQPPYLNRCGELDAAGDLLAHLLGPLQPRAARATGELIAFDQGEFTAGKPVDLSMAARGQVYVPAACRGGGCRVHVAFHGCRQSEAQLGLRYVEGAGYNEWADSNRLVVLYPQTQPRYGAALWSWRWVFNPKACWDWWGYTDRNYATRDGGQIRALRAMLARLAQPVVAPASDAGRITRAAAASARPE